MKLNIANPTTGAQKLIEITDENRLRILMDKRMAEEIDGDSLGDEFKGYVFKITGGNDKEGFPMRQGVLVNKRVRLLLRRGMPCYHAKRKGERRRKSVRGCIIGPDLMVISMIIVKRGEHDLPGLTDVEIPRRLGPKRVDKIRKMFNLTKSDNPKDYVVRRKVKTASGNTIIKKPKIQRLITPTIIHRRRSLKKRVENRKKLSYEKRKAYFERLTKKSNLVKQAKGKLQQKPQDKKQQTKQKGKQQQQQPKKKPAAIPQKPTPKQPAQPKSQTKAKQPQAGDKKKGKTQGQAQGKAQGQAQGKAQGKPQGKPQAQGKPQGQAQGKPQGQAQGKPQGQAQGKGKGQGQGQGQAQGQAQGKTQGQAKGKTQGKGQQKPKGGNK